MGTYTFTYLSDIPGSPDVALRFDDTEYPFIEDVLAAVHQFLLGVTFQPGSINKYLSINDIEKARYERAKATAEFKSKRGL